MDNKSTIIREASDCTVDQFIKASFEGKYRVLLVEGDAPDEELKQALEIIEAQYVDISGLYQTREFEMSAYVNLIGNRVSTIERFIALQFRFIDEFQMPFTPAFGLVKKYGHHLTWDPEYNDLSYFKQRLTTIELKEKKYRSVLNLKINELIEFRKKGNKIAYSILETRQQFITTLNRLQQEKFVIHRKETFMDELALMIKDYKEQIEESKIPANAKKGFR